MPNSDLEQEIQNLFRYLGIGGSEGPIGDEQDKVDSKKYRAPTDGSIVSRHHPGVPTSTHPRGHFGVDIGAPQGTPVYAIGPGVVSKLYNESNNPKGGNAVITSHEDGKVTSYYAHLDAINVNVGDEVDQNTQIGTVGTSGMIYDGKKRFTAPHLHWQVKIHKQDINPLSIREKPTGQLAIAHAHYKLTKTAKKIRLGLLYNILSSSNIQRLPATIINKSS